MDNIKTGKLIRNIRNQKGMTQKELANRLNLSEKTISKWERGQGCPDIASINDLAEVLGVNVTEVLSGEAVINDNDAGNLKKLRFYVCPECGNIITSTSELILNCCGKKLAPLQPENESVADLSHTFHIEHVEDEIFVKAEHPMEKAHFITFVSYVTSDKMLFTKLYPEQNAEARFKMIGHGMLYLYCKQHGLWRKYI